MDKLTLIFVGGDSFIDKAIEEVSKGDVSHTACILFDSVYESTGLKEAEDKYPAVWLHDPDKYTDNPYAKFIQLEIPDMAALKAEARKLLGSPYGYVDCIRAGIFDLLNMQIPDSDFAMDCSETVARLIRAGGINILPDVQAGCIDPARLYKEVLAIGGQMEG